MTKLLLAMVCALSAGTAIGKVADSKVEFFASAKVGFVNVDFMGIGGKITSDDDKTFRVDLTEFKTGDEGRDEHFLKIFTKKSKYAFFTVDKYGADKFSGKLTLNSVTKAIEGKTLIKGKTAECEFYVNVHDFGISKADITKTVVGVNVSKVDPMVKVKLTVKLE